MNKDESLNVIKEYTLDELELIYETQKDLYSEKEMKIIAEKIQEKNKDLEDEIKARLPKDIICPKCDGPNPFENNNCSFCDYKFDKSKYYGLDYYDTLDDSDDVNSGGPSYTFQYVISFLVPLIGFILGAILLSKEDEEERSVGKSCIILGIVSMVVSALIWIIIITSLI